MRKVWKTNPSLSASQNSTPEATVIEETTMMDTPKTTTNTDNKECLTVVIGRIDEGYYSRDI